MEKFDIPSDYCFLPENIKISILELSESIIRKGGTVNFKNKDFKDINELKKYLENYCGTEVKEKEDEIFLNIKKWKSEHQDFFK